MKNFGAYQLTSLQKITIGFAIVVSIGTLLLMLPFATRDGQGAPLMDAMFTAVSTTCVTGLIVHDTATYWTGFGQLVMIILIQIGGLGAVTVAAALAVLSGQKIGLIQRSTLQDSVGSPQVGGVIRLMKFILKGTFLIELAGACLMLPFFVGKFGWQGIWYAVFHSVSAFCNGGFDLMGAVEPYSSLTTVAAEPVINLTIMALIILGGIGFLTWEDVLSNRLKFNRYRMQTKVILTATAGLIFIPTAFYYFEEFTALPPAERFWCSLFQSVTMRTAGFNSADLSLLTDNGRVISIILMVIGAAPGSTAGGMKVTTPAVLMATAAAAFNRRGEAHLFGRRIPVTAICDAAVIMIIYLLAFVSGGMVISWLEGLPLMVCLFETASAVGTVGISLGATPQLSTPSHIILMLLMFIGRVGGLSIILAALSGGKPQYGHYPHEKITVG